MEITTEAEFRQAKPKFHKLLAALTTLVQSRSEESQLTSVDSWVKNMSILKGTYRGSPEQDTQGGSEPSSPVRSGSPARETSDHSPCSLKDPLENLQEELDPLHSIKSAFEELSLLKLYAFFLASKLGKSIAKPEAYRSMQYKLFQDIYNCISKYDEGDFTAIHTALQEHLGATYAEINRDLNLDIQQLKELHQIYWLARNGIMSESKNLKDFSIVNQFRKAAVLMEYIGKKYKGQPRESLPPFWKIQNELVRLGLLFRENQYPGFEFGSQSSLATILGMPLSKLAIGYIIEKLAERVIPVLMSKGTAQEAEVTQEKINTALRDIVDRFEKCAEENSQAKSDELVDEFIGILHSLKEEYGFSALDIFNWAKGLQDTLAPYEIYKPELGKKSLDKPRLLIVGDSVPAGFGLDSAEGYSNWTAHFSHYLQDKLKIKYETVNCSIPGHTTAHGLAYIDSYIDAYAPDVVFVTLGGNDIAATAAVDGDNIAEQIESNMLAFVKKCKAKGVTKIIWGLGVPDTFTDSENWHPKMQDIMKQVAERALKEKEHEVNLKVAMLAKGTLTKEKMYSDNLHPTSDGHKAIMEQTFNALKKELWEVWDEKNSEQERPHAVDPKKVRKEELSQRLEKAKREMSTLNLEIQSASNKENRDPQPRTITELYKGANSNQFGKNQTAFMKMALGNQVELNRSETPHRLRGMMSSSGPT